MLKNIDAMIFDLDGTLIDSMWIWKDIDNEYLKKYKIQTPLNFQKEIDGLSFTEAAIYFKDFFHLTDSVEKIKKDWNSIAMNLYCTQVPLKKNAIKLLNYGKRNNLKMGIASSNSRELVDAVLKVLEIDSYFDTVVTSCEAKKGKPEPDVYLLAAKNLNVCCEKCLVFEDVIAGIKAGQSASMKVCAVEDAYSNNMKQEKIELADYYISDFLEVFNYERIL
jgi:16S rRNA pseudouridine516 synthase